MIFSKIGKLDDIIIHPRRIIHDSWFTIDSCCSSFWNKETTSKYVFLLKCYSNSNNHGWMETGQPRGRLFPQQGWTKNCWIKIDYRSAFKYWHNTKLPFVCKSRDISDSVFSLPPCHILTQTYLFLVSLLPQPVKAITVLVGEWWDFHHAIAGHFTTVV